MSKQRDWAQEKRVSEGDQAMWRLLQKSWGTENLTERNRIIVPERKKCCSSLPRKTRTEGWSEPREKEKQAQWAVNKNLKGKLYIYTYRQTDTHIYISWLNIKGAPRNNNSHLQSTCMNIISFCPQNTISFCNKEAKSQGNNLATVNSLRRMELMLKSRFSASATSMFLPW